MRRFSVFSRAALIAGSSALASCATLPTSGPTTAQVLSEESAAAAAIGYRIVEINAATTATMADLAPSSAPLAVLAESATPAATGIIGAGDTIEVTLFEVGAGLFGAASPAAGYDPSARGRSLGAFPVSSDGSIDLPYAGTLQVGGLTPDAAARRIEAAFKGLSQQPQAQVRLVERVSSSVLFSGAVAQPGRFALAARPETLTEALAMRGGPSASAADLDLRLTRGDRSVSVPLRSLLAGSAGDIALRPGDRIELLPGRRSILAFGAMNAVREIPFETATVSLAEAIARAGGPSDARADPSAVFVFRDDPQTPTIYRLDLLRPSGYFLAQRFPMRDKDLIYVANSASNQPSKLIDIINRLFQPLFTIEQLTN